MPFQNEHSCRVADPGQFDEFRRENGAAEVDGKSVDHIYGISGDSSELQAIRYPVDEWTENQAENHCTGRDSIRFEPAEQDGEQAGGWMNSPDAPRELLQTGTAITDSDTDDLPTVRVVPITEGERVTGFRPDEADNAPAIWDKEPLQEAVEQGKLAAPDGSPTKIVKGGGGKNPHHELGSQVPPEDILGKIERWEYEDGVGPVGYADIVDEEIADRIDADLLDVSADWFRSLGEYDADRDGKPVDKILALPRVTVLDRGASDGASIEPATAEALGYNAAARDGDDEHQAILRLGARSESGDVEQLALYPMQFFGHGEFVGEEFINRAVNGLEEIAGVSAVASDAQDDPELVAILEPEEANLNELDTQLEDALDETPFEPIGDFDWVERVSSDLLAATGSGIDQALDELAESSGGQFNSTNTMSDEDLHEQLAEVRQERDELESETSELEEQMAALEDEKSDLEEQLSDLEEQVEAKADAVESLQDEIAPWKEMLARIAASDSMLNPEQVAQTQSFEQLSEQVISTMTDDEGDEEQSPMEVVEEQLAGTVDPRGEGSPDDDTPEEGLNEEQLAEANDRAREVMGADDVMAAAEEQLSAREYVTQAYGVDPASCDSTSEFRRKVSSEGGD